MRKVKNRSIRFFLFNVKDEVSWKNRKNQNIISLNLSTLEVTICAGTFDFLFRTEVFIYVDTNKVRIIIDMTKNLTSLKNIKL